MTSLDTLLATYRPLDATELGYVEATKKYLAANKDCFNRKNFNGHVTGSAFVLNKTHTHALLVHHAKLHKWVQPGGHVEATDTDVLTSATREAWEESGIKEFVAISKNIFDVDAHEIPANPKKEEAGHMHYDVRFLLEAQSYEFVISDESTDIAWVPLEKIPSFNSPSLTRMAHKAHLYTSKIRDEAGWVVALGK